VPARPIEERLNALPDSHLLESAAMTNRPFALPRILLAAIALVAESIHLGWEYSHGGVVAHHFLARADMPSVSNWWGLLLIPALTWFLAGRIERRLDSQQGGAVTVPPAVWAGFFGALAYGAVLALAFTFKFEGIGTIFLGIFALSLLFPTYRAEYVLGFVLGMAFTFGAILPTFIATIVAALSGLAHWLMKALWRYYLRLKMLGG
jgi:hypothetical protein